MKLQIIQIEQNERTKFCSQGCGFLRMGHNLYSLDACIPIILMRNLYNLCNL